MSVISDLIEKVNEPATIRKDSELLQHVEILTGDFEATFDYHTYARDLVPGIFKINSKDQSFPTSDI